jgi:hypothetical protein
LQVSHGLVRIYQLPATWRPCRLYYLAACYLATFNLATWLPAYLPDHLPGYLSIYLIANGTWLPNVWLPEYFTIRYLAIGILDNLTNLQSELGLSGTPRNF